MRVKSAVGAGTFVLGMAINPAAFWGCGDGDQPVYGYGEAEMLALLDSLEESSGWEHSAAGASYFVELELAPSAQQSAERASRANALLARRARACGTHTRTFTSKAAACSDIYETELPLAGTVSVSRSSSSDAAQVEDWQVTGRLLVRGLDLSQSSVSVELAGGGIALRLHRTETGFALSSLTLGALRQ